MQQEPKGHKGLLEHRERLVQGDRLRRMDELGEVELADVAHRVRCRAALAGDVLTARRLNEKLLPLHQKLFVEANPIPVKWAMNRMGLCGPTLRLPMTELSPANAPVVEGALRAAGLI